LKHGKQLAEKESGKPKKNKKQTATPAAIQTESVPTPPPRKKLSYKFQRELDQLPGDIEKLELEIATLQDETTNAAFQTKSAEEKVELFKKLSELQVLLEQKIERWAELESS